MNVRRNKYNVGSKEDRTADNICFDSIREKNAYINQFRPLMRSGIKVELQKPYQLFACGGMALGKDGLFPVEICKYLADFVVTDPDGTVRVYDVKGVRSKEFIIKAKMFHANYPHLRIVEL